MDGGADWSERYEFLNGEDQKAVLGGWDKLMNIRFSTTYGWLTADGRLPLPTPSLCRTPEGCSRARMMLSLRLFNSREHGVRCNILHPWNATWGKGMCNNCVEVCKGLHDLGREEVWEQLPGIFELPEWGELIRESKGDCWTV